MAQIYLPERTDEARPATHRSIAIPADDAHVTGTLPATPAARRLPRLGAGDIAVMVGLAAIIALIITAAGRTVQHTPSANISLSASALPLYSAYSFLRMLFAYILSLAFTLAYAHVAATNERASRIMIPILDVLQSIPILSFLPGVVLTLVALFPHSSIGVELAAVFLIFTCMTWNMTFSFYDSAKTLPLDLREAAVVYRLSPWRRFFQLEVPFGMIGLVWNSMMSWAGGWFFLMVAEQLQLGNHSYQLPGLGSYLQKAATQGNIGAMVMGLGTLIVLIVLLDAVIWRPLVSWADKFKLEMTRTGDAPESRVLDLLRRSALLEWVQQRYLHPLMDRLMPRLTSYLPSDPAPALEPQPRRTKVSASQIIGWAIVIVLMALSLVGVVKSVQLLAQVNFGQWLGIFGDGLITMLRTLGAMVIGIAWTVPVGVAIGMNPKWAKRLQPIVQVVAAIPATAVFPILLLLILRLPAGIEIAALLLMVLGTQWYVLFNIIAGASAIPTDMREAARLYQVTGWRRWKTMILPAIFPYLVTGMVIAAGGSWNASVVAEYIVFNGHVHTTRGLGADIAQAAANQNMALLLASTLVMAVLVVLLDRGVWHRLYKIADRRFKLEL
jgi:NitT/TauT family transport system permease protein